MVKKLRPLKLKGWTLTLNETVISLKQIEKRFVPKYELFIKEDLDKNRNIFQTTLFNHTMIFFKLID